VLLNYNHDLDSFFNRRFSYLRPLADVYEKQKDKLNRNDPAYKEKLEVIKNHIRTEIMNSLGKDLLDIEEEHLKLSNSFGINVGITNDHKSILDYCNDNLKLMKSKKYPPTDYVCTPYSSNFFILLTVLLLITLSQRMIL
jgi:hypothetical protein